MKKVLIIPCLATALTGAAAPHRNDRADLLAVERAWDTAIVKRDVKALDRIIADDFQLIWINGQMSGKREMLEGAATRLQPASFVEPRPRQSADAPIISVILRTDRRDVQARSSQVAAAG